jgi:hypothetical protein
VNLAQVLGWLLVAVAAIAATRMWWFDRRLQAFRAEGTAGGSYRFIPLRWRRELYTTEATPLLRKTWQAMWTMYGTAFLAMLFLAAGAR